jgi:uncharacterized protein
MNWTWDQRKFQENLRKHGLDFETARAVFDDPLGKSRPDNFPTEERWQTIGMIRAICVIVVHTFPAGGEEVGRIISARRATRHERKEYEEGSF